MTFQERRTLVSLFSTTLVAIVYFLNVFQRYAQGQYDPSNLLGFWASAILIFIPVSVLVKVVVHVIFVVLHIVVTHEQDPDTTDELERLIELKATRNFYHVFMAGFLLSLGTVVIAMPLMTLFIGLIITLIIASIVLDISQLYYYRIGV